MAVSHLLSVLVLGAVVNAAPPLLSNIRTSMPMSASTSVSASAIAGTPTVAATTPAASASAAAIVIPESVIDAAPILDLEVTSPLNTIKGDGTNSTLTDARPDLKEYVDTTVVTDNNATTSKRNLVRIH